MSDSAFSDAADAIRQGRVVAAATDTLIGLLADATEAAAIEEMLDIKERPTGMAVALIAPSMALAATIIDLTPKGLALARQHWPGPLTIVGAPRLELHPALLLNGRVGVRVPAACDAVRLARACNRALTASSANTHGQPSPASTADLDPVLRARLLHGGGKVFEGDAPGGLPSTIIDDQGAGIRLLRAGAITIVGATR